MFFLSACVNSNAVLNISTNSEKMTVAPTSQRSSIKIAVEPFSDYRSDSNRVGFKRNAYRKITADVLTKKPVATLIQESLTNMLKSQGHTINGEYNQITLSGAIDKFWVDVIIEGNVTMMVGSIQISLELFDEAKQLVFKKSYTGVYDEPFVIALDSTRERIMQTALENLIQAITVDGTFANALERRTQ